MKTGSGNGQRPPLSVGVSAPPPARNQGPGSSLPGPDAAIAFKVQQSSNREQCRARCVPDQTVIPGIPRSLRDKPPSELTCGYEAYDSGAYVLPSSRSHQRPMRR
jgi:hypothetical protein